jgi:hypothetical protein
MSIPATFKVPKQRHKAKDAAAKLLRISGNVVSADEAVKRTGRTRHNLLALYREGKRTWEALAK